ncbi:MAG: galactokinase, partial [Spirochaetaceae bacterium]|nr:galactokinase [Spirochaetaceae bacterium]
CLALSELFLREHDSRGACRVHGGGFAGVIQVFLPEELVSAYTEWMDRSLGVPVSPVYVMSIRPRGVIEIG